MNIFYHWAEIKNLGSISPRETEFGFGVFACSDPFSWSGLGRVLYALIEPPKPAAHRVELSNCHGDVAIVDIEKATEILSTKPADECWYAGREEFVFDQKVQVIQVGVRIGSNISSKSRWVWADGANQPWGVVESGFAWGHFEITKKLKEIIGLN